MVQRLNKSTHIFPRVLNTATVSLSDPFIVLKHTIGAKEATVILETGGPVSTHKET
jgi:hypothetical protein